MHRHKPQTTEVRAYRGPVAARPNPKAHGNVCFIDRCRCGAERATNSNAGARERGPWVPA